MTTSDEAFRLLSKVGAGDYSLRESETAVAAGPVRHALDPQGRRTLLLPLDDQAPDVSDNGSRGVVVRTGDLIIGGDEFRFIFVTCVEPGLSDLFAKVCDEILAGCENTPDAPGQVTVVVLERWRELLGPGGRLLSESELKGLLAELHLLERLAALDPAVALSAWTGPDRAPRDFSGDTVDVEVKASAAADEVRVRIHGLAQLTPSVDSDLYMVVERLELAPLAGDSVPAAVERLVSAGVDRHGLLNKLGRLSAKPADFSVYENLRFKTLETLMWLVDDDFPRLTAETISDTPAAGRVHGVEYVLDLAAVPPARLDEPKIASILMRFIGGAD